jgi:hypothetical protein
VPPEPELEPAALPLPPLAPARPALPKAPPLPDVALPLPPPLLPAEPTAPLPELPMLGAGSSGWPLQASTKTAIEPIDHARDGSVMTNAHLIRAPSLGSTPLDRHAAFWCVDVRPFVRPCCFYWIDAVALAAGSALGVRQRSVEVSF